MIAQQRFSLMPTVVKNLLIINGLFLHMLVYYLEWSFLKVNTFKVKNFVFWFPKEHILKSLVHEFYIWSFLRFELA